MLTVVITCLVNVLCAAISYRWLDRQRAFRRARRLHRPRALELAERSEQRMNGIYVVNETPYRDTYPDGSFRPTHGHREDDDRLDDHLDYPARPVPMPIPGPGTRFSG